MVGRLSSSRLIEGEFQLGNQVGSSAAFREEALLSDGRIQLGDPQYELGTDACCSGQI